MLSQFPDEDVWGRVGCSGIAETHRTLERAQTRAALRRAESPKFERAALRWLGRLVTEHPVTLDEARVACLWLSALPGPEGDLAATSLSGLAYRRVQA
jgi:hypothetical protein